MRRHAMLLSLLSVVLLRTTGLAQAPGQVGLTMTFPTAAGLTWHTTDRIAILSVGHSPAAHGEG